MGGYDLDLRGPECSFTIRPGAFRRSHDHGLREAVEYSLEPIASVEQALDLMRKHALNQATIDWPALRKETLALTAEAEVTADAYAAIRFALAGLRDHHSHLSLTPELEQYEVERLSRRL